MPTTVSNGDVDTGAAAISAPYGPLTRVTDITTMGTPNSDFTLEFETAVSGVNVFMTYDQLVGDEAEGIILEAIGFQDKIESIKTLVNDFDTAITAMTLPHTYANYKTVYNHILGLAQEIGVWNGLP